MSAVDTVAGRGFRAPRRSRIQAGIGSYEGGSCAVRNVAIADREGAGIPMPPARLRTRYEIFMYTGSSCTGGSLPVILQLPGRPRFRDDVLESRIVQQLNRIAPPRDVLRAFARIDPFPSVAGPAPPSQPPDTRVLTSAAVRRARPSVVRVTGVSCGIGVEGSGWVARRRIVVTAAHVVAGASDIRAQGHLARLVRVVEPPQCDGDQCCAQRLAEHLGLHDLDTRSELAKESRLRLTLAVIELLLHALDFWIAVDRPQQQAGHVRVVFNPAEPRVPHGRDLPLPC